MDDKKAGGPTAGTPTAGTPTAGTPTAGTPTAGTPTAGKSAAKTKSNFPFDVSGRRKRSDAEYMEAIRGSRGLYSVIGGRLGVARQTAKKRINERPKLAEAYASELGRANDKIENVLYELAEGGDIKAIAMWRRQYLEDYRDEKTKTVKGDKTSPVEVVVGKRELDDDELLSRIAAVLGGIENPPK